MTIMQLLCTMKVGNLANLVGQAAVPLIGNWLHQGLFQSVTGFLDHQFTSQASSPLSIHITSATDQTKSRTRTPKPVTSKRDLHRPHTLQVVLTIPKVEPGHQNQLQASMFSTVHTHYKWYTKSRTRTLKPVTSKHVLHCPYTSQVVLTAPKVESGHPNQLQV
jgi:hypothetical protein